MHELGVARDLIRRASEEARRLGEARVTRIRLAVGPEGGFKDDALEFALYAAAVGTAAEGAQVVIRRVPEGSVVLESVDLGGGR